MGESFFNTTTILCYLYYNNNKNTVTCDILVGSMEVGVFMFVFIFFVCLFVCFYTIHQALCITTDVMLRERNKCMEKF